MLIDSTTTSSLECNKKFIGNIIENHGTEDIEGHDRVSKNDKSAKFKGLAQMPHNGKGKTNVLNVFVSVKLGFVVPMDTGMENKNFVKKMPTSECLNQVKMGCVIMIPKMKNISF